LTKFGTMFGHFCMSGSEWNEPKRLFMLQKATFSVTMPPNHPFWTNF